MFVLVALLFHGHVWGSIRVHLLWVRPCFSSSVLMSGSSNLNSFRDRSRCPYSWCHVGCCCQDLFKIARSILVYLPSSFFSSRFVSVHVVQPYSSIDVTAAWKKMRFISSVRSDFHIIDSLLIAVPAFVNLVSMSLPRKQRRIVVYRCH